MYFATSRDENPLFPSHSGHRYGLLQYIPLKIAIEGTRSPCLQIAYFRQVFRFLIRLDRSLKSSMTTYIVFSESSQNFSLRTKFPMVFLWIRNIIFDAPVKIIQPGDKMICSFCEIAVDTKHKKVELFWTILTWCSCIFD